MKVLQINQSDLSGGAAIAGFRLHQSLQALGVDSHLFVGEAKTQRHDVTVIPRRRWLENQLSRLNRRVSLNYVNLISSFDLPKHPLCQQADVLHLHNLHTGYFNYLAIPALTQTKPVVWTLHDMWSLTGHCAYSYDCDRWQIGCGRCPYPQEYPEIQFDSSAWEWRLKQWVYGRSRLHIVTPSQWLANCVERSLLGQFPVQVISAGLDLETFRPQPQAICRELLGIERDRWVLLFGVENLAYRRKGGDLLEAALQQLPPTVREQTMLLTFGRDGDTLAQRVQLPAQNLGYIQSDRLKAIAYNAADLYLLPTRADNFPIGIQESLACGTPVVACAVGGVPEQVVTGQTGYLAQPEDPQDFAHGIEQLWRDRFQLSAMSATCRRHAAQHYRPSQQAHRYLALYEQLLDTVPENK